jgi:hypothetical protein
VSPRFPATDDQGRPVVAELGRPETPDEIADRKAASSSAHRANQTLVNLLLAIGASLVIVLALVLLVVRPAPSGDVHRVDYRVIAAQAQPTVSTPLAAPALPDGWYANRAELDPSSGEGQITTWAIGLVTPASRYIGLTQGVKADATWTAEQVGQQQPTGTRSYGGLSWKVYDHRTAPADAGGGEVAYALVARSGASTVVLTGSTATEAEFATLATAIGRDRS